MTDDVDVEDLLEAPFKKEIEKVSCTGAKSDKVSARVT